jgi:hypothetical protein
MDELMNQDAQAPDTPEAAPEKEDKKQYRLDNGQMGSRSAYIRQEFMKDRARGDIAKELGVSYGVVFSATTNMHNAKHPEGAEGHAVARGVIMEDGRSRAEHMRDMVKEGKTRGEIAKHFGAPYATVYAATKDLIEKGEGTHGGKVMIEWEGVEQPRVDVIRELFAAGKTRREIANLLACDYAVVWSATKVKGEKPEDGENVPEDVDDESTDGAENEDEEVNEDEAETDDLEQGN